MRKQVLGLWIVPDYEAEKPGYKGDDRLCYKTHFGPFEKGAEGLFVTTPAFQEWIQGNSEWIGKNLGSVELRIHEKEKKIKFMWFYPFGEDKISVKGESKHPDEIFGRKGIGAFAFFRVLKETKELFPSFKISFGTSPTTIMRKMLVPMGWKRPYRYKISTATKRTRDYVARKMRDRRRK